MKVKGGGLAVIERMAGQPRIAFANKRATTHYARDGRLHAPAVTCAQRATAAPALPMVAGSGVPGYEMTAWHGASAPAKTPCAIIDLLHDEIVRALNSPDLRGRSTSQGADPTHRTPEEYTAFVHGEVAKRAKVIKAAGVKPE